MTTYAPTAPFIVAPPQSETISPGNTIAFTVVAAGSAPLAYQWYFNTNTPLANATNVTLILANVQATNAGTYSVMVTNAAGSVISSNAILIVSSGVPSQPQLSGFIYNNDGTFSLTVNGDTGPDYIVQASTNLTDWASIFTNHSPTPPFIWTDHRARHPAAPRGAGGVVTSARNSGAHPDAGVSGARLRHYKLRCGGRQPDRLHGGHRQGD